jgi:hypothetical protein
MLSVQTAGSWDLRATQWLTNNSVGRFNVSNHLSVGFSFGAPHRQELAMRLQHYTNMGFKKLNTGENSLNLRYAYAF